MTFAGLLAGASLAALGLFLAPNAVAVPSPTISAPLAIDPVDGEPWWFEPFETLVGPTAILLDSIDYENSEVVVRYELHDIAPRALGRLLVAGEINPFFAPPREDPVAAPERWVLETVDGEFEGTSASTRVRSARFDVPDDFVLGTITGLRVESYRMRIPYVYEVEMPPVAGAALVLDDRYAFSIASILSQRASVIFQLEVTLAHDSFVAGEATPVIIRGVGPDWVSYNQRQFEGLQLTLGTPDIPDPLRLEVRSTYWVPFQASVAVDLRGVNVG